MSDVRHNVEVTARFQNKIDSNEPYLDRIIIPVLLRFNQAIVLIIKKKIWSTSDTESYYKHTEPWILL